MVTEHWIFTVEKSSELHDSLAVSSSCVWVHLNSARQDLNGQLSPNGNFPMTHWHKTSRVLWMECLPVAMSPQLRCRTGLHQRVKSIHLAVPTLSLNTWQQRVGINPDNGQSRHYQTRNNSKWHRNSDGDWYVWLVPACRSKEKNPIWAENLLIRDISSEMTSMCRTNRKPSWQLPNVNRGTSVWKF